MTCLVRIPDLPDALILPNMLILSRRLCKYFDGTHHLEEIMLNENMTRTDLLNIIDRHLPMLYTMQAPDAATSYYVC